MVTGGFYGRTGNLVVCVRRNGMSLKQKSAAIEAAQRAVNRVALYRSVYPLPHRATRIAAFVIAARLEAEREAAR